MATPPLRRAWPVTVPAVPWAGLLALASAAVFLLVTAVPGALRQLAFVPADVAVRPWTLLTYPFVHAAPFPLVLDLGALALLAPRLESRAGGVRLLIWFGAGTAVGAVIGLLRPTEPLIGAGPALLGLGLAVARLGPADGEPATPAGGGRGWLAAALAVAALLPTMTAMPSGPVRMVLIGGLIASRFVPAGRARRSVERRIELPNSHFNPPGVLHPVTLATPWDAIDLEALHEVNRAVVEVLLRRARELGPSHLTPAEVELLDRMANAARVTAERRPG